MVKQKINPVVLAKSFQWFTGHRRFDEGRSETYDSTGLTPTAVLLSV